MRLVTVGNKWRRYVSILGIVEESSQGNRGLLPTSLLIFRAGESDAHAA
jgi:hypothetical protein